MKKSSRFTGLVLALLGAMVLLNSLDNPRVAALHVPDVMRLVASGMGFGIGFVGLMGRLNFASSREDQAGRHATSRVREGVGHNIRPRRELRISTV